MINTLLKAIKDGSADHDFFVGKFGAATHEVLNDFYANPKHADVIKSAKVVGYAIPRKPLENDVISGESRLAMEKHMEERRINVHYTKLRTPKGAPYVPIYGIIKNAQHLHVYTKTFFETVFSWALPERDVEVAVREKDGSLVKDENGNVRMRKIHMRSDIADFYKRAEAHGDLDWIKEVCDKVGFELPENK